MATDFSALNLHPQLVQAVVERGYVTPTPIQEGIIPLMIEGRDVIGQAQTGTGKTAAFALPILHNLAAGQRHVQAIVLTPTRELAIQVSEAMSEYGQHRNVRVLTIYGGQSYHIQISGLKRGADIVVGTPGRVLDLMNKDLLDISNVRTLVLDEADEMLSMGFIEDIETILNATPAERQTALFSATMPTEIRRLADKYMHTPQSVTIQREQMTVAAIEQRYYMVHQADKIAALSRLFEMEEITSALIFVRTRAGTGDLANELTARGYPAEALNGDLNQEARERTLNRFRQNKINVLVATDVAARGLDIDDISHVINYELPEMSELYVHRIGRTGRAGKTGIAISLVAPYERRYLRNIESYTRQRINKANLPTEDDILKGRESRLLRQVTVWLQRNRYRREKEMVEQLIAEGHDPIEIAAAALKVARADEKQRPIAAVAEVLDVRPARPASRYQSDRPASSRSDRPERSDRGDRGDRSDRGDRGDRADHGDRNAARKSTSSHEPGMVRLSIKIGKQHGVRPNDIVGAIAAQADIPGNRIGKIYIEDTHSLVDVPEDLVRQVLTRARNAHIFRQPLDLQLA